MSLIIFNRHSLHRPLRPRHNIRLHHYGEHLDLLYFFVFPLHIYQSKHCIHQQVHLNLVVVLFINK